MAKEIFIHDENNTGKLIKVLQKTAPEIASTGVFKLLRKGKVRVNNDKVKDHTFLIKTGDVISLYIADGSSEKKAPQETKGFTPDVLFEDECLYIINKPSGIAVHSGAGKTGKNIIDMLSANAEKNQELFLVHRLDKYTSGVLILAKTRKIAGMLQEIIRSDDKMKISKFYSGIVFGKLLPKGQSNKELDGKPAFTQYKKIKIRKWKQTFLSLADIQIKTGKKHQIRRHLAEEGFPVAGDDLYGNWQLNKFLIEEFRIKGTLLHCKRIVVLHPVSHMLIDIQAPLPEEFSRVMDGVEYFTVKNTKYTK